MIGQRFNLFYAGYTASLPASYFQKQKILEGLTDIESASIKTAINSYLTSLLDDKPVQISNLTSALNLAETFDLAIFELPNTSSDYFKWFEDYVFAFESKFPMMKVEHYYFLYARKIAEILSNLEQIILYVDLQLLMKDSIDYHTQLTNSILNCEFIVFKLMAPAALLAGEPRHGCFNVFYKQLNEHIQKLGEFKKDRLDDKSLIALKVCSEEFKVHILNAMKRCITTLNKLSEE